MAGLDYILETELGPMKLRASMKSSGREAGHKFSFVAWQPREHISLWQVFVAAPKAHIHWKPRCSGNQGQGEVCFFGSSLLAGNLAF